jgi:hypothetical protein
VSDEIARRAEALKAADPLLRLLAEINLAINLRRAGAREAARAVAGEVSDADA